MTQHYNEDIEKTIKDSAQPRTTRLLIERSVPVVFVVIASFLTIFAFWALRLSIENINNSENDNITRTAINAMVDGLDETTNAAEALAAISAFSYEGSDKKRFVSQLHEGKAADMLDYFDHVVLLNHVKESGKWSVLNLQDKPSDQSGNFYKIILSKEVLKEVAVPTVWNGNDIRILSEESYFQYFGSSSAKGANNHNVKPFALAILVDDKDYKQGIILAVSDFDHILGDHWQEDRSLLTRISVRDTRTDRTLFHRSLQGRSYNRNAQYGAQRHEFRFGNQRWEISTQFSKGQQVYILSMLPYFALVIGLLFTALGALYLHSNYRQSLRARDMALVLEGKNSALENEIESREKLNISVRKSEREHRAIIDSVNDIIFETDSTGELLFVNETWERITGFSEEQAKGMNLFNMLHKQDQDKQKKDFDLLIRGQKSAYRSFARIRTSEGTFRAIELSISMIRRDENNELHIVGTITDVEERRRAERALSEAEKKYRTIVENAAAGIYQLTPEGIYLSANSAMVRILGYGSAEELLTHVKNAHRDVYAMQREHQSFLYELEQKGYVTGHETRIVNKQGEPIWVSENARVVRDDEGNVLYYEGSLEDVTARKESDMLLREAKVRSDMANRAKSEFLANMGHELRTPLNAIIGFSEIIKNETFGPVGQEPYKEYATDIHDSGHNLLNVINEILDISKIETGDRELKESSVRIHDIVDSSIDLLKNKISRQNVNVSNLIEDLPDLVGEEVALKQVMMNLISNAVKFTPAEGNVSISAEIDAEGEMRVSVTDTGIGLEPDEIERVLSPFSQLEGGDLDRDTSGVGLGLTLVKSLVGLHDGRFELFSEKGIGTTATIILPKERVQSQSNEELKQQASADEKESSLRDGSEDNLKEILEKSSQEDDA